MDDSKALTPFQPASLEQAYRLAEHLGESNLMPEALRGKPADIFVTLVTGHELGLSPMQAVRSIFVVKGKPVASADLIVALCVRHREVCEYVRLVESTDERAVYAAKRVGHPEPTTMVWTMAQAQKAGLTGNPNWKNHPAAMLRARCASALCRAVFPDLVLGVYETGEGEEVARNGNGHREPLPETAPPSLPPPFEPGHKVIVKGPNSVAALTPQSGIIDVRPAPYQTSMGAEDDGPPISNENPAPPIDDAEKAMLAASEKLDAFYEDAIAQCKTKADCEKVKAAMIADLYTDDKHPLRVQLRTRYNSIAKAGAK